MSRTPLPNRRQGVTIKFTHTWAHGGSTNILATFGFDDRHKVREVFCSSFKEGSDLHTLIIDACMVLSLLLQHGYSVQEVRQKFVPAPGSLLASLMKEAEELEK